MIDQLIQNAQGEYSLEQNQPIEKHRAYQIKLNQDNDDVSDNTAEGFGGNHDIGRMLSININMGRGDGSQTFQNL